ncbi:MAG: carboxylesterase family protein [Acidobacteriota bacterium]|jgi:para-nitrobenzyl esterase|nr:carboxylesterase family protein [Acidobacteriota bacterium]
MKKFLSLALLFAFLTAISACSPGAPETFGIPTARVTGGQVEGTVTDDFSIFKGIPFAAPPVGELRWKSPQPVAPWTDIKQTVAFGNSCMQNMNTARSMGDTSEISEDCLYLNVWSPAARASDRLPVLVWIYGGGFTGGMTSVPMYDGEKLAGKGVVVVSIAYRVGPFGFLAHSELSKESGRGSGNYGLEDMIAGLEWVKNNVGHFGGDPSKVTIFGHSAGGMAVSMLAASPASAGLFRGVISMSGASMAPLRTSVSGGAGARVTVLSLAETEGATFLEKLGAADIAAARGVSAADIQNAIAGSGVSFRPVADGHIIIDDQYLQYQTGRFNDTPILLGSTSDEAASFGARKTTAAEFVKQVNANYGSEAAGILAAYPHANDAEASLSSKYLSRDNTFGWNTWTWARMQAQNGTGKAFLYYFDHHAPDADGTGHGLDVPYAFQTLAARDGEEPEAANLALSDVVSSYWVNFTKTGDPNAGGLPVWPAYSDASPQAMVFRDGAAAAETYPNMEKLQAMDKYFARLRAQAAK